MHTGKYMWYENGTTAEMTSYENDAIIDIDNDQSEVDTYHNYNYVGILSFGLENATYISSTYEWE